MVNGLIHNVRDQPYHPNLEKSVRRAAERAARSERSEVTLGTK